VVKDLAREIAREQLAYRGRELVAVPRQLRPPALHAEQRRSAESGSPLDGPSVSRQACSMGLFKKGKRRDDAPVDPDERSPQLGLKYKDLGLLGELMDHGANLDQPRHVVHFSYFPSALAAAEAGTELRGHGWNAEVRDPLPSFPDNWSLVCERHDAVLTPDFVRDSTDLFEGVAALHGGDYDGWEAAV
jgi:hypothetical protein